ncbi:hypothetical protein H1R20_g2113, partial [Candolleomyces eurysporus]
MSSLESLLASFKDFKVSRGHNYHYYFSAPEPGKLSLLLVHGFPSLAIDWHHQINYFKAKGYGLVVPDQLGYGGTDKPVDHKEYLHGLLAKDLVEIVDHEKLTDVIAIGHDWGSKTTSVLGNLFADRFLGFGFFAAGYVPPRATMTFEQLQTEVTQALGYGIYGYWDFLSAPDAVELVTKNVDSFLDLIYAKDPSLWKTHCCPTGALRTWVENNSRTPRGVTEELQRIYDAEFSKGGWTGPLNYYKAQIEPDGELEDAKKIPLANYKIHKPVFLGCALKDEICLPAFQKPITAQFCPQTTVHDFDTGHWVLNGAADEVNEALDKWIAGISASGSA